MASNPGVMAASPGFFLDSCPGGKGAYSLRRLSGAAINVVQVRRDSDQAEADFTPADIDSGALAEWVGAGNNGYIVKLYDQSSNDNDAGETTLSYQPTIIDSGTLVTSVGLPAVQFTNLNNLDIDGLSNTTYLDCFYIIETSDWSYLYPADGSSNSNFGPVAANGSGSGTETGNNYGSPTLYVNGTATSPSDRDDTHDLLNGRKLVHHFSASSADFDDFQFGRYGNQSSSSQYNLTAKVQAMLFYDADQSGNRASIDASLNSYYEIY